MKCRFGAGVLIALLVFPAVPAFAQENDSQWAPTASFMIGKSDSGHLSKWLEEMGGGLKLEIAARSFDVGACRGRAGHSYFCLTYVQTNVEDGSQAIDGSTRYVTRGMRVKGFRAERMFRVGPSKWPVAPMFTISGGAGKISGMTTKYDSFYRWNPQTRTEELVNMPPVEETAKELFDGYEWMPLFGLSAGLTASTRHLTITVAVYGIELFPGSYKGLPRAIYWPR